MVADKCHPSNFHFVFPYSPPIFHFVLPLSKLYFLFPFCASISRFRSPLSSLLHSAVRIAVLFLGQHIGPCLSRYPTSALGSVARFSLQSPHPARTPRVSMGKVSGAIRPAVFPAAPATPRLGACHFLCASFIHDPLMSRSFIPSCAVRDGEHESGGIYKMENGR